MKSNWNYPTTVWVGKDRIKDLGEACHNLKINNPLFVTDKDLVNLPFIKEVISEIKKKLKKLILFSNFTGNPFGENVDEGVKEFKQNDCDGVITIGGGSAIDVGKAIAFMSGQSKSIWDFEDVGDYWKRANNENIPPIIAIPTTAGTGSEVTPISIITMDDKEKKGVSSKLILPDLAILDPLLTINLPPNITASTGIDAMVHAIEAYTSTNPNNNPISKMLSIEALKFIGSSIKTAVFEGYNINARSNMLFGSMLAGKAFANSPVAAVHALAYPIGGLFNISHGLSNSLVLPSVMKFNSKNEETKKNYAYLSPYVFKNLDNSKNDEFLCNNFIDGLERLCKELNLPYRLRDLEIPQEACQLMASEAMKQTRLLVNNPRKIEESDAFNIYKSVW